ncbi:MAG TPA: NAD(P)H-binding protein [Polyangiaceae bacterium]|nr:NAD(P)H-binding protein [Polyangiaceae bacterium]
MKAILFGATGMVGQGVLRECLLAPDVERVLAVGRAATGQKHEKLRELVRDDLFDLSPVAGELSGYDACFFCLGVSSAGMSEEAYRRVTYDLTMAVARTLLEQNPAMTFVFVSGAGTDGTEKGRSMWARVKGEAENAVAKLPFKATYMFRPAFIQPLHGITSRTKLYRAIYAVGAPLFPLWNAIAPKYVTTTEEVGRAMLEVARRGAPKRVLENDDIRALGRGQAAEG